MWEIRFTSFQCEEYLKPKYYLRGVLRCLHMPRAEQESSQAISSHVKQKVTGNIMSLHDAYVGKLFNVGRKYKGLLQSHCYYSSDIQLIVSRN